MDREDFDDDAFEAKEAYQAEIVKDIVLPKWLTREFPTHLPHMVISFKDGNFVTSDRSTFATIEEAYDYASSYKDTNQVVLDASVDGHGGRLNSLGFFFCDPDFETGKTRLLMSYTTEEIVSNLKHDYLNWLTEICIDYSADPDDFITAHKWLSHHPVFWSKGTKEKSFNWATDVGLDKMSINIWADKETGKPVVFLEHGAHYEKDYISFYHDARIFVQEETFEEAVISMAKKVNAVFDTDGYERNAKKSDDEEDFEDSEDD